MTSNTENLARAVRELEAAENDAGANGHTDAAHARIVKATEAIRVLADRSRP